MTEDIYKQIGRRVREERVRRGWTQEQLAERAEIHLSFIGQLERGVKKPSLATIKKISNAFGTKAGDLLDEGPIPTKGLTSGKKLGNILRGYSHSQQESLIRIFQQLARQIRKYPRK